jgi:gliding motility-associated-like protein
VDNESNESDNTSSASILVQPFFIPNVITPNEDGLNDTFEIKGIGKFLSNDLVIFNRWGDHLYQTVNYENNWAAQGLVNGTYFYVFTGVDDDGKRHEFRGWIQVITQ